MGCGKWLCFGIVLWELLRTLGCALGIGWCSRSLYGYWHWEMLVFWIVLWIFLRVVLVGGLEEWCKRAGRGRGCEVWGNGSAFDLRV